MPDRSNSPSQGAQGQGLLVQHRELLARVNRIEDLLSSEGRRIGGPQRRPFAALLEALIEALEVHLAEERQSLDRDFEDVPALRAAFAELDRDHPKLIAGFASTLDGLQRGLPWDEVSVRAEAAIAAFRDHEAREDALFAAHS